MLRLVGQQCCERLHGPLKKVVQALHDINAVSCCLPVNQFQHLDSFNLTTVCFAVMWSHRSAVHSKDYAKPTTLLKERPEHNTENYMPYYFRLSGWDL